MLGHCDAASAKVTDELVSVLSDEEYYEVVHVGEWEDRSFGDDKGVSAKVLKVSTDWVEHSEEQGDERYEPSRNVEIVRMEDYSSDDVRFLSSTLCASRTDVVSSPLLHSKQLFR